MARRRRRTATAGARVRMWRRREWRRRRLWWEKTGGGVCGGGGGVGDRWWSGHGWLSGDNQSSGSGNPNQIWKRRRTAGVEGRRWRKQGWRRTG
ncbi:hypothetical protein U1Q18_019625 [Sarracenia purpurea var. burkii]